jgi:tetratricopeptide (TPR) repeat protein
MRRALVVALCALQCAAASADELDPARLYARGERAEALAALAGRGEPARKFELQAVAETGDVAVLRAALMLATDWALLDHVQAPVAESSRSCGLTAEDLHTYAVADQLQRSNAAVREFVRRWFVARSRRSQWDLCLNDASKWAKWGLEMYPKDAGLLLAQGAAMEAAARFGLASRLDRAGGGVEAAEASRRLTDYLTQARDAYAQAVGADAGLLEARLRHGRVLWHLGENERARADLERVAADASAPPPVAYLAQLFLARVHDDAGRPAEAERAYRAALALAPTGQSAAVGLAQLLGRRGGASAARELLEEALEHAPRREPREVFWTYPAAFGANGEEELARLREEASPTDVADPDEEERDTDSGTAERSLP